MRQDRAATPFPETLSRLSQHLAARAATNAGDPVAAARARQQAMQAHERRRHRRLLVMGGLASALLVGVGIPLGLALVSPAPEPPLRVAAPQPEPQGIAVDVATAPARGPDPAPPAVAGVEPSPAPAPSPAPLDRAEVRDVQARLRGFGFDPGPIDGDPGARTLAAAWRYQENRNQPRSEAIDRALLEQLRLDPAPVVVPPVQVAQRGNRGQPAARGGNRPTNPFDQLGRWLDSLVR